MAYRKAAVRREIQDKFTNTVYNIHNYGTVRYNDTIASLEFAR